MKISCVISTWNKREAVDANVRALKAGTRVPDEIVVVDNCSSDDTVEYLRNEHPDLVIMQMSTDKLGACETFNVGFRRASGDAIAIMDDDVEATTSWLEILERVLESEPDTTAAVSSRVIEPGMPEAYQRAEVERGPYYASTFRGCGTLMRAHVLRACGGYDERLFIYGNERDLTARVVNAGYRILQHPEPVIHHQTPFGMKAGKRSLYYHVRNFWLCAFKYAAWSDVFRAASLLGRKALFGGGASVQSDATARADEHELEATGTLGVAQAIRETPGAKWIVVKASLNALMNLPYCISHRQVVRDPIFRIQGL